MTEHYYTKEPSGQHDEHSLTFRLLNHELTFVTDAGVFSKHTIDYGTRTMLENFRFTDLPQGPFLDLGAGYGPVAIALAKAFPDRQVVAAEINERAVNLIERNAKANDVSQQVTVVQSDCYEHVQGRFAAILVNPPVRAGKQVVQTMLSQAPNHLETGGTLTVVLQKKQGAPSAKQLMKDVFGNVTVIAKDKGYYIMESRYHDRVDA